VQALLDACGPERARAIVQEVVWGSRFRVHHRVVDTSRAGRILLAGDAAHVHSPAGGQGMNTGIQDAMVLAEALATTCTSLKLLACVPAFRRRLAWRLSGLVYR